MVSPSPRRPAVQSASDRMAAVGIDRELAVPAMTGLPRPTATARSSGAEAPGHATSRCLLDQLRSRKHLQELSRDLFVALQRQLACAPGVGQGLLAKDDAS